MDRRPPAGAWFRGCAALLAAICCLPPARTSAQTTPPPAPQQLTGSLTYHSHLTGSGPQGSYVEDFTATFTGIQMRLDSSYFPSRAHYEVQSYSVTVKGTFDGTDTFPSSGNCPLIIQTSHYDYTSAPAGTQGGRGQLFFSLPCGPALVLWAFPIGEHKQISLSCPPSSGSDDGTMLWKIPYHPPEVVGGSLTGSETVAGGVARVDFDFTSPVYKCLPDPDYSCTLTESLKGTLKGAVPAGAQEPKPVDLEIDGVPSDEKQTNGGLVIAHFADELGDNMAPRQKITLSGCGRKVILDDPGPKVKIHTDPEKDTSLRFNGDNEFNSSDLPKSFYVEGVEPSEVMGDIRISAHLDAGVLAQVDPAGSTHDFVNITSLGATTPEIRWQGEISTNNRARDEFRSRFGSYLLGPNAYNASDTARLLGCGIEGRAHILPSDFDPLRFIASYGTFSFKIDRDVENGLWHDVGGNCQPVGFSAAPAMNTWRNLSAGFPPGNDEPPEDAPLRDDKPQSAHNQVIYFLDAPGLFVSGPPTDGTVYRARHNFRIAAVVKDNRVGPQFFGQWLRLKPPAGQPSFRTYWVGTSWTRNPTSGYWDLAMSAGDNQVVLDRRGDLALGCRTPQWPPGFSH